MPKSYLDLNVYQESFDLFIVVHEFSRRLPKYELYEQGSQIRRSADSVNSNIVEGYGRKEYKKDFLRFLTYSRASNDETVNHLRKIASVHPSL
jgi:four helix bundle protein